MTIEQQIKFNKCRADLIHSLVSDHMYGTLALMQQCNFQLTEDPNHVASLTLKPNTPPMVTLHVKLMDDPGYFKYAMLHELRHIPQVARFGSDDFLNSVPWPSSVDTPVKRKTIYRLYSNTAMDMALNEDLRRMFGEEEFQRVVHGAIEAVVGKKGEPCVVTNPAWQRDQSFVYYMLKLIEEQENKDQDGGEGGPQGYQQMDGHGFGEDEQEGDGAALRESLRDLLERVDQEAKTIANQRGHSAADQDLTLTGNRVDKYVRDFIRMIKVKVNRLYEGKSERRYAFEKFNRIWPKSGLPGHKAHRTKVPGIVVVLDTSGSVVGDPTVFEQLRGATLELERTQKVAAVYCCDVALTRMTSSSQAKGGGGTLLGAHHFDEIRKDLGLKPGEQITVVGLGDGDWDTETLMGVSNVDFHELILRRG